MFIDDENYLDKLPDASQYKAETKMGHDSETLLKFGYNSLKCGYGVIKSPESRENLLYQTYKKCRTSKLVKNFNLESRTMTCRTEGKHQCPHCEYKATQKNSLKRHIIARHTNEKPHQCPHCDYKSAHPYNVKAHIMYRHTRDKPFQCPHCEYKAILNHNLKTHIFNRHSGEKPHQCPHCDYKAAQLGNVKSHIKYRHTFDKPYHCPHCHYKAASLSRLKRHTTACHD